MKRKTLIALGLAGAFACSAASATTYLCVQDPTDVSFLSCAEIMSDALASAAIEYVPAAEPTFVTYYLMEPSLEPASDQIAESDLWLRSEPMSVTYFYTFDPTFAESGGADESAE